MMRRRVVAGAVAGAVATALVGGPLTAAAADVTQEPALSSAVAVFDVDYSEGERPDEVGDHQAPGRWRLNLVIPEGCPQPLPVFVDNPGSGWSLTDTKTASHVITRYCYAFAGVNDSASSLCTFPCTTHDVQAAIRWLRAYADGWTDPADGTRYTWSLDPNRIAMSGHSSGGWQAAFTGTTNGASTFRWPLPGGTTYQVDLEGTIGRWEGIHSSDVQAYVPLHPAVDFSRMNVPYTGVGVPSVFDHDAPRSPESVHVGCTVGTSRDDANPLYEYDPLCEAKVQAANPIRYVTPDDPPTMLFHGSSDLFVPHSQSADLYSALRDGCSDVRFYSMTGQNHWPGYLHFFVSAPYTWYESVTCRNEHAAPGPPEQTVLLPEGELTTRYAATWAGVAAFLDDRMRETTPPQLAADASGNPRGLQTLRRRGFVSVDVQTDEASSYEVEATVAGRTVGRAAVPLHQWGSGSARGTPPPHRSVIEVPLAGPGLAGSARTMTLRVTAADRVGNAVTEEITLGLTHGPESTERAAPAAGQHRSAPATGREER